MYTTLNQRAFYVTQSFTERPPVQKLASAFLYISQTSGYLIGNMQNREGLSIRRGSVNDSMVVGLSGARVRCEPEAERLVLITYAEVSSKRMQRRSDVG